MRRVALLTAIILLTIAGIAITWQLRNVVLIFFVSLAVAATLDDPVDWLANRAWPRSLALIAVYLSVFGILFALAAAIFIPIVAEIDPLIQDLVKLYGQVQSRLLGFASVRATWVTRLPSTELLAQWLAGGQTTLLVQYLLGLTQDLGRGVTELLLAIVLAIYWTADRMRFERLWLSLLAPEQRARTRRLWRKLDQDLGAYVRSEFVQTILAVALFAAGYALMGIKYPFVLALLAGLAWLVPLLGGALALIPVAIVASLAGPGTAVAAVVYTVIVLVILEFYLQRRLYTEGRYWGVVLVLVMLAMADVWGLFGLIVAPPIALAIQIGLNEVLSTPTLVVSPATDLSVLQGRVESIRSRIRQSEDASPRIVGLVGRLDHLMAEVESMGIANFQTGGNDGPA